MSHNVTRRHTTSRDVTQRGVTPRGVTQRDATQRDVTQSGVKVLQRGVNHATTLRTVKLGNVALPNVTRLSRYIIS